MTKPDIKMSSSELADYVEHATKTPKTPTKPPRYTTIIFDSEEEYVRFYDQVFEKFGGKGLRFTNVPIPRTTRISPWLMEQTQGQFEFRPVTREDLLEAAKRREGRKPFDPANIDYFLPAPKPRTP